MNTSIDAFLFDRDGTLIADVPYNGDPDLVAPLPTAAHTLERLRGLGYRVGVVSNQAGIGRGLITEAAVRRVNDRVAELLGPFDVWRFCPHAPEDGCRCRKPRPGMVLSAAAALSVPPRRTVMVGDIGSDVDAARAAGAHAVLVPTTATLAAEIARAPRVASTLAEAVAPFVAERERAGAARPGTAS